MSARKYFRPVTLYRQFQRIHRRSAARGLDRTSPQAFRSRLREELLHIEDRALSGTYAFTPYREALIPKGKGKAPREIAVPTVRDRVTLRAVNQYLAARFPFAVFTPLANEVVKQVAAIHKAAPAGTHVIRLDIATFFDSIDHAQLARMVQRRAKSGVMLDLIAKSLACPSQPAGFRERSTPAGAIPRRTVGVPQGLPTSNALANIYLESFDRYARSLPGVKHYWRYVDDILLFVDGHQPDTVVASLVKKAATLNLRIPTGSDDKFFVGQLSERFAFLGYEFTGTGVTISRTKEEAFIDSLARYLHWYNHNRSRILTRCGPWLSSTTLDTSFVEDFNERLTGAVSGDRLFGWLPYHQAITNTGRLHRIDSIVGKLFARSATFGGATPTGIRRTVTALHRIRAGDARRGYLHNFDRYRSDHSMLTYLTNRGILDARQHYSPAAIRTAFSLHRQRRLRTLEQDEGEPNSG